MSDDELSQQYESEIENASDAFAKEGELEGITLQPYTPDRAWAAQAMGLKCGFIGEAGLEEYKRTGLYPGILRDIGIVLWLRSLSRDIDIDVAARNPVPSAKKAADWAHEHGIADGRSPNFQTAYDIFIRTMNEVSMATTVPKK